MADININIGADAKPAVEGFNNVSDAAEGAAASTQDLSASLEKQEARIKVLDGVINTLGGSVELLAGGMAVSGLVSEENAKQFEAAAVGAIAFADGAKRTLDGVKSLTEGIKAYGGIQKFATAATQAFGVAMKVAMGPVGIAITAIGAITAAIVLLKDKFEAVNKVAQFFSGIFQKVAEFVGLAATEEEKYRQALSDSIPTLEYELKLSQARGDSIEEQIKKERELLQTKRDSYEEGTKEFIAAQQELDIFEAKVITDREAREKAAAEKRKADQEKAAQERFDILNKENVRIQQELEDHLANIERLEKESNDRRISNRIAIQQYYDDLDREAFEADLKRLEDLKKAGEEADKAAEESLARRDQAIRATLSTTVGFLTVLRENVDESSKEGFEKGKKYRIAETRLSSIQAAFEAYKGLVGIPFVGPVLAIAAAAAALAAGQKAIREIQSSTFEGGSTPSNPVSSASGPSVPGTSSQGGFLSLVPPTPPSQPVRAYVVTGDVTNGLEAEAQLQTRRQFGPG